MGAILKWHLQNFIFLDPLFLVTIQITQTLFLLPAFLVIRVRTSYMEAPFGWSPLPSPSPPRQSQTAGQTDGHANDDCSCYELYNVAMAKTQEIQRLWLPTLVNVCTILFLPTFTAEFSSDPPKLDSDGQSFDWICFGINIPSVRVEVLAIYRIFYLRWSELSSSI